MNKFQLVELIARDAEISHHHADASLESLLQAITQSLTEGEPVRLAGFGTFKITQRKARTGRNPRTGEPIRIPSSSIPGFSAGKVLKEQVADGPSNSRNFTLKGFS